MKYDINSYCTLSKVVEDRDYAKQMGIIVKSKIIDDKPIHILNYNRLMITPENTKTLGLFRSVITDGEKVLSFSPPKGLKFVKFHEEVKFGEYDIEYFVEGTMINVFYHNGFWECSTKGTIGAKCKFFRDYPKTFRVLFLEALNESGLEFDMLNKEHCYSFVLQHPENRIVVPFINKKLYLVNVYKCDGTVVEEMSKKEVLDMGLDIHVPELFLDKEFKNYHEVVTYFSSLNIEYKKVGIVLKKNGVRTKLWNPNYLKVKGLRGNSPKIQFQYYNLLKDKRLHEFLKFFPEYEGMFKNYKMELFNWTEQLWKNYKACYIRKEKPLREYPKQYKTHMFQIHQKYLNDLKPDNKKTDKLFIIKYVNLLEPAQLMFGINYVYRNLEVDLEKNKLEKIKHGISTTPPMNKF